MGYTGHSGPTPPRSFRIVIGAKIAALCMFFGSTVLTNQYHRAQSMKEAPDSMTWEQLVENGLGDNAFVSLTNVELSKADQNAYDDFMGAFDADADPAEMQRQFAAAMEDVDAAEAFAMSTAPVKIIPIGSDDESVEALVVVPRKEKWMTDAEYQIDKYGSLTGYVSAFSEDEVVKAMFKLFGVVDPILEERLGEAKTVYTIHPMREPIAKGSSAQNFWLCGLLMAFSIIVWCSGGPSIVCCIFFMGPSVISLLGYPMRYGRGGNFVKLVYLCAGGAITAVGYNLLIVEGQFGNPSGNPILHAIGFVIMFSGFAATLSVPTQIFWRKLAASVEPKQRKKDKRLSYEAACSLKPPEPEDDVVVPTYITRTTEPTSETPIDEDADVAAAEALLSDIAADSVDPTTYFDSKLIESDSQVLSQELQTTSDSLSPLGFADPLGLQRSINGQIRPTAIQLGCQQMVVSDVESNQGELRTLLLSVLHDGMAVITVSQNFGLKSDRRTGTSGFYFVANSNQPIDMMSEHLEQTVGIAERRDTTVVLIDNCEIQQACLFGRRVLAEIQSQYGEIDQQVASKNYGRFNVPASRVVGELTSS
jgi:hypothetical protein